MNQTLPDFKERSICVTLLSSAFQHFFSSPPSISYSTIFRMLRVSPWRHRTVFKHYNVSWPLCNTQLPTLSSSMEATGGESQWKGRRGVTSEQKRPQRHYGKSKEVIIRKKFQQFQTQERSYSRKVETEKEKLGLRSLLISFYLFLCCLIWCRQTEMTRG